MTFLEVKATELHKIIKPSQIISPILIAALIQLLAELIKTAYNCYHTPKQMLESGNNPGLISRLIMKRFILKNLSKDQYDSVDSVIKGLMVISSNTTVEQMQNVQTEIQGR